MKPIIVPYAQLLGTIAKHNELCTKLRTSCVREVSNKVVPKDGLTPAQRCPRFQGGFDTGYVIDDSTTPDERLATERCYCSGGAKRGCTPHPNGPDKGKKCSFVVDFDYYLTKVQIRTSGSHGANFKDIKDWQAQYHRDTIKKLDSFGPHQATGRSTPKQVVIDLHAQQPQLPHIPITQVQSQIYYNRQKALGPGNNVDQLLQVLENQNVVKVLRHPIGQQDLPSADTPWQIILASDKLLDAGAEYGLEVIGLDSRFKNTDVQFPLSVITAACKDRVVFPIGVMISSSATTEAYEQFLNKISMEIDQRLNGELWDPYGMIDHCDQERKAFKSRQSFGRKVRLIFLK